MKLDLYYGRYYPVCVPCAAHRILYDAYPHMLCRLLHMCHNCPVPILFKKSPKNQKEKEIIIKSSKFHRRLRSQTLPMLEGLTCQYVQCAVCQGQIKCNSYLYVLACQIETKINCKLLLLQAASISTLQLSVAENSYSHHMVDGNSYSHHIVCEQ